MKRSLKYIVPITLLCLANHALAATPAEELRDTVATICPQLSALNTSGLLNAAEQDLFSTCRNVLNESDAAVQNNALSRLASDETSTMKTMSVEITSVQTITVLSRLQVLRSGGAAVGLASNLREQNKVPVYYAGPVTSLGGSGDQEEYSSGRLSMFLNGAYGAGDKSRTDLEPGFDYDAAGFVLGADYRFRDNFYLGVAGGYASTSADVNDSAGDLDVDGYGFSVYGSYSVGGFYLDAVGTYGIKEYEISRRINYTITPTAGPGTGTVDQTFVADTDGREWSANLNAGYNYERDALTIGPYARLNYLKVDIDGYTESLASNNTNAGFGAPLKIEDQDVTSVTSDLGAIVSYVFSTRKGVYTPYLRFEWEHEFDNDSRIIRASYVNGTQTTGNVINIPTDEPDRDYMNLSAGVSSVFPGGLSAFLDYTTVVGHDTITGFVVNGGVRYEF